MKLTPSQKETVQYQFDTLCRNALRGEARDYLRHINWRTKHETSLSELSEEQLSVLCTIDEYPSEQFHFQVQEYSIPIKNELLAAALESLPVKKRDIVLLSYYLDMTDQEIADKLDMVRSTVQRHRTDSLEEMKKRLEVINDGKKTE